MSKHTTQDAIRAATNAVRAGASLGLLKQALMSDGFPLKKAEQIILWALQAREKHEKDSRKL
jgi:hypothetical protein